MAVNINTVYTTVLFILNKEQRGYIPPAEFNSLAQQVQQEIFDSYFPDGNQLNRANQKNIQNDTEFFNMFKDNAYKVAYFEEDVTFSYDAVNEVWLASTTRPLYRIGEIISTYTGNPTLDSVTELASKKDFTEIRDNPEFHDWAEDQPDYIQKALYENEDDPRAAARAIDLYKADMGIKTTKKKTSKKDAAKAVDVKSSTTPDNNASDSDSILESDVAKMTSQQYAANEEAISKAIRSGKFIYDVSGAARA